MNRIPQNEPNVKDIKEKLEKFKEWLVAVNHALVESHLLIADALKEISDELDKLQTTSTGSGQKKG